ncbi:hypothetical protein FQA39_LY12497 [Lamprigera yunnana]|nr:hypothetical protein FQA39_LY12497 [Lamprigera yunnana]
MAAQFSKDAKYFAQLTADGKLKLWETATSSFIQEFTPDYHLASPCTCLHFVERDALEIHTPRKKKRRDSLDATTPFIAMGTTSGKLLVYSIGKGDMNSVIDSKTNLPITCMSWIEGAIVYSAVDWNIYSWDLKKNSSEKKWKTGNEVVTSMLVLPWNKLITGARTLKIWDTLSEDLLHTFTGHSHNVCGLNYISPSDEGDAYFISGSKGDRLLSAWSLNEDFGEKNAIANFLMEDVPVCVSTLTIDGTSSIVAVTQTGKAHFYQHSLNGKCVKPLKSKTTLQIAMQQEQNSSVGLIPIIAAHIHNDLRILLAHGNEVLMSFENVTINEGEKLQTMVRKDPEVSKVNNKKVTNVQTPSAGNAHYVTPHVPLTIKRKNDGTQEVPMEKRLENLTLNKLHSKSRVPSVNNVAQLLIQGLHSKDKTVLRSALSSDHDEAVIKNTIKRLPIPVIAPLVLELTSLIQGTLVSSQCGCLWLKNLLQIHSGIFISNPDLPTLLAPILGSIESRLSLLLPLNRLRGRLDLLVSQVTAANAPSKEEDEDALLMYNDKESSDSDSELLDFAPQSESENEWNEESDEESNAQAEDSENDVEMV